MGSLRDLMRDEETLELRMLYKLPEIPQRVKKRRLISAITYLAKKICHRPKIEGKILIKDGGLYPELIRLIRANLLLNRISCEYSFIEGYDHIVLWLKQDNGLLTTEAVIGAEWNSDKPLTIQQITNNFQGPVIYFKDIKKEG